MPESGVLVEKQGFNEEFSVTTLQEFMVRTPGKYRNKMTANDVAADIMILIRKS
jgi:hypothetical protein